jgi:tRNA-specific 2-thiouridylase
MGAAGRRRYALVVDVATGTVVVGPREATLVESVAVPAMRWTGEPVPPVRAVLAQCSAHGEAVPARYADGVVQFSEPRPRVAPGQSVVLYDGDEVLGGARIARAA